jgi:hypothetical protein
MSKNPKLRTKNAVKRLTKADQRNLKDLLLEPRATSTHLIIPSRGVQRYRKVMSPQFN